MAILITSDIHLSDNARDAYRHQFQKQLRSIVKQQKIEAVFVLGDLTEDKDRHSAWLVNQVVEHFYLLSRLCPVVILRGNHDLLDQDNPFFEFMRRIEGITWISSACDKTTNPNLNFKSLYNLLMLPHTRDYKQDWAEWDFKQYEWIFTHNTFSGAYVGHQRLLKGIPIETIPKGVRCISGDVHVPQKVERVTYVGAPYLIDFGDDYKPRVLIIRNGALENHPVSGPQKRLIEVPNFEALASVTKAKEGDILKVRVGIEPGDKANWRKIQAEVRAWGEELGCVVHIVEPVTDSNQRRMITKKAAPTHSDEQLLETFAKRSNLDAPTTKTGLALMKADA